MFSISRRFQYQNGLHEVQSYIKLLLENLSWEDSVLAGLASGPGLPYLIGLAVLCYCAIIVMLINSLNTSL